MYVRIKRKKQTYFLHCENTDTIKSLKEKITAINNTPYENIQFHNSMDHEQVFQDETTLQQGNIGNDAIIVMVYRDGDSWEPIQIDEPEQ
ncbi:UBX domain-containing protein [Acrasis kona]|uniref:UBX domain-containing protein n=1 Tax=Acrasis kona TaxID=1008807 RepID=A0AAW2ZCM8_9EUKA